MLELRHHRQCLDMHSLYVVPQPTLNNMFLVVNKKLILLHLHVFVRPAEVVDDLVGLFIIRRPINRLNRGVVHIRNVPLDNRYRTDEPVFFGRTVFARYSGLLRVLFDECVCDRWPV